MRFVLMCACVLLATVGGCADKPAKAEEGEQPAAGKLCESKIVLELFSACKKKYPHLVLDEGLCVGSQKWADRMAETGRFRHDRGVKENIAKGYRSAESCMQGWFTSRGHNAQFRVNTKVGFGANLRGRVKYWVARFK